ncbi:hypothetical protein KRR26_36450 [Corallococcus sp. M34]|uniref:hypothetical protein n=1 Tax=Citreicoccus inhibens TaxID=2849499 RepID=UPI0011C3998B|nr:hypothetical protein [Citreicoccus inhibens]MBU8901082.1 hypothetical protein [Citreicoccus inhibens]
MGIAVAYIGFEGPVPSFEKLRDVVSERLGTPVDLTETQPGFWVGMMVPANRLRGFSIERHGHALAPEWPCTTPEDELLLRVLAELGGTLALVHSPAPRRARNWFSFSGPVPTPEQVEERLSLVTRRVPSMRAYEFPNGYELRAPLLVPDADVVTLYVEPYGFYLTAAAREPGHGNFIWDVADALKSLGGTELDPDSIDPVGP